VKKITIAIDGYAGCGKSTTAKNVAKRLNYLYIDSGAMYRAVTWYFVRHGISFEKPSPEMKEALENIFIDFVYKDDNLFPEIVLNGKEVESEIRQPEISAMVSKVAIHRMVRKELVSQQHRMGDQGGVVMDGRDIGTVVFPNAELKVFMTADLHVRAKRRKAELDARGIHANMETITENLKQRDLIDTTRKESPLKRASDAIVIDTTYLTFDKQVDMVCDWAWARIEGKPIMNID
jgi:cytidylate kinase